MVTEAYYRDISNTCYNIESEKPKLDICDTCEILKQKIKDAKDAGEDCTALEKQLKDHQTKASVA